MEIQRNFFYFLVTCWVCQSSLSICKSLELHWGMNTAVKRCPLIFCFNVLEKLCIDWPFLLRKATDPNVTNPSDPLNGSVKGSGFLFNSHLMRAAGYTNTVVEQKDYLQVL